MCLKVFHLATSEGHNVLQAPCLMWQSYGEALNAPRHANRQCSGILIPSLKLLLLPAPNEGRFACDYTPLMSFDYRMAQDVNKTRHTATENTQGCNTQVLK